MTGERQARNSRRVVRVLKSGEHYHVWFCHQGKQHTLAGMVGIGLANDARRHGQDLVGNLVDKALQMADRQAMTG
jgi:hypothetical protein